MIFQQLAMLIAILVVALVLSMFVHTFQSRRKILKNLQKFSGSIKGFEGKAVQKNILSFPSFEGKNGKRKISAFFHVAEGKQTSVIYFTSAIDVKTPFSLFLKKEHFYRPVQNNRLEKNAGNLIPDVDPRFEIRSHDEGRTRRFFRNERVVSHLANLENYPAIQCGPDAVIISKPYDGVKDTLPEAVAGGFELLHILAEAMESVS